MNNQIITTLSSLLGCGERTANSVYDNIISGIGAEIETVTAEKTEIRTTLAVTDKNGEKYTVLMGRGYFVREIYCGNEKIYSAIQ